MSAENSLQGAGKLLHGVYRYAISAPAASNNELPSSVVPDLRSFRVLCGYGDVSTVGIGRAYGSLFGRGMRHEPLRWRLNDDQNG